MRMDAVRQTIKHRDVDESLLLCWIDNEPARAGSEADCVRDESRVGSCSHRRPVARPTNCLMLTDDQLQSIMPRVSATRKAECLPFLQAAMAEFAIDRPARAAAFLAQLAHESGEFRFMEEIWGPTAAQRRYEPQSSLATVLGNTAAGDGKRFKGRGPIQITGRANYRRFGSLLAMDLVADPARAAAADVAFRIAGLFWSRKGLNELADIATEDAFREITRRINGGFNGLAERRRFYANARTVLGVPDTPATRGRGPAMPGATEEPTFDRGAEAIRVHGRRAPTRKASATTRKTKPRRAGTRSGRAKPGARGSAGSAAAAPRRKTSNSTAQTRTTGTRKSSRRKR
jgi:putative chitinase